MLNGCRDHESKGAVPAKSSLVRTPSRLAFSPISTDYRVTHSNVISGFQHIRLNGGNGTVRCWIISNKWVMSNHWGAHSSCTFIGKMAPVFGNGACGCFLLDMFDYI